ncbi:hypothetical protein J1N35_034113 [Gossypium stocksii]|uniref:Reverse transcriptase n=1 Tax=Gossypium stocksii TaxID=47602 RepID=A0A9D3ZPX2_9ROSI|nr:hypothetical protein J1N35_034113 [Gossypium stocksii]
METKICKNQMERVRHRCGYANGIDVDPDGTRGGLSLAWKAEVNITLQRYSKRYIDVVVDDSDGRGNWKFTGFYGSPYVLDRNASWDELRSLYTGENFPWLVCGDFNEILYGFEKKGGIPRDERRMELFRNVLADCDLADVGYSGRWFTWERGSLLQKLETLKTGLKRWSTRVQFDRKKQKEFLMNKLSEFLAAERDDFNMAEMIDTKIQLNLEIGKNECYWEQRARINWLKYGDRNTSFFHNQATNRRRRNMIHKLQVKGGGEEKIKVAMFEMGPTKAPGEDGLPALFYQKCRHIIGDDVMNFCLQILNEEKEFKQVNSTHIVLIPKVVNQANMKQFRPISLCNVIYKIMAKVITNRLRGVIEKCIDVAQSAFVPERLISDNVLLAYEILHTLKQKRVGRKDFMAVKLNMSKAYDRVEWQFIEEMLTKMGFDSGWIKTTTACLTSVSYSKGHGRRGIHWCEWKNLCTLKENGGLGFCNMCQFNFALLAKQGWRLITYPNSLLARVLKAKYYPDSDFFNAQLGNLPSLTWKSVWAAKGKDTVEWSQRNDTEVKLISDLINVSNNTWKTDLVENTFPTDIAQQILQIPPVKNLEDDIQIDGKYGGLGPVSALMAAKTVLNSNVSSSFAAEAYAGLHAVKLRISLGFHLVMIKGDSRTIVNKCQQKRQDKSVIGAIISDIHRKIEFFQEIRFCFIKRGENALAHKIAVDALRREEEVYLEGAALLCNLSSPEGRWRRDPD